MLDTEEVIKQTKRRNPRKGAEMAYKKPEIVAKSDTKQSFVGACPEKTIQRSDGKCSLLNSKCLCGPLR